MGDHYRPLTFEEQVELFRVLFSEHKLGVCDEDIKNLVACNDFYQMKSFMEDIGILITHDALGVSTSISTFNNDQLWIKNKLRMFYNHFK